MSEKLFFSTGDVAKLMNVSPTTIFRAIDRKVLKASTTPGGHYRISRSDLEQFLRDNNVPVEVLEPRIKRVLIVEDNAAELRAYQRTLESEPRLDVRATASGYEAGFLTKSFKPDLILLDIFLDDADGRQVARLIRMDPELKDTKIVAMTGSTDPAVLREVEALGFDAFISKPVEPEALVERVRRLLK
jgi:excisionase family DNA binding protein